MDLQQAVAACGWKYVCRTVKNIQVQVDGEWHALEEMAVQRGRRKLWRHVRFTAVAYGPVQVIGWWAARYDEPLYLVTHLIDRDEACRWYQRRAHIEPLNREVKRRTEVMEVFPTDGTVLRLVGAIPRETADEWAIERRCFSQASMLRLVDPTVLPVGAAPALAPVR